MLPHTTDRNRELAYNKAFCYGHREILKLLAPLVSSTERERTKELAVRLGREELLPFMD